MATDGQGISQVAPSDNRGAIAAHNAQIRDHTAQHLIRAHVLSSLGMGLVSLNAVDLAALFSQQLTMISSLGKLHGQEFCEESGKASILTLIKAALPPSFSWTGGAASLLRAIPGFSPGLASPSPPILAGATSYALGQVFHRHFSLGGTLRSFDPARYQGHFEQMFRAGLHVASQESGTRGMR